LVQYALYLCHVVDVQVIPSALGLALTATSSMVHPVADIAAKNRHLRYA